MGKKWLRIGTFFAIVIAIGVLIFQTAEDVASDTNLGLDLQGGFEVLYQLQPEDGEELTDDDIQSTATALNQRVNVLGVSEPAISVEGEDRIRVQLPGVEDQQEARATLGTEAELTFRDVDDNILLTGEDLSQGGAQATFDPETNAPIVALTLQDRDKFGDITAELSQQTPPETYSLSGWILKKACHLQKKRKAKNQLIFQHRKLLKCLERQMLR
ncbi:hypothetical protein [Geomicrobium sp. JCM 19039]|uniref:hypothetical protein n=1 Tax=Geomicrobium sp. JCM 19039 TaxID=1460636 RepID=UPI000ABE07B1|nr:hypothetical protein [Geomicrobium sp. JCM 19039]